MLQKDKTEDTLTTVSVTKSTRNRLRTYGSKGETYDVIISRMMDATIPVHGITEVRADRVEQ